MVKQVRRQYACHDRRMTNYRHRVWDLIEGFDTFNIQLNPRKKNQTADSLAQAASTLQPLSLSGLKRFTVELTLVPSVPDNVTNFQVFEDDKHILDFITNTDVFGFTISANPVMNFLTKLILPKKDFISFLLAGG